MKQVLVMMLGLVLCIAVMPAAGASQTRRDARRGPQENAAAMRKQLRDAKGETGLRAAPPIDTDAIATLRSVGPAVTTKAACFLDSRADAAYDMEIIDVTTFGAIYDCANKTWSTAIITRDDWYADELDYLEFYFDTDDNLSTGCLGDDYSVYGFWDEYDGWLAGVWKTPSCNDYYWDLVAFAGIGRNYMDELVMTFYESAIGSPSAIWYYGWLENMYSYDLEEIGDGYAYLLDGFHSTVAPSPTPLEVNGTFNRTKIGLGATATLSGSLSPYYSGAVVSLQKLVSGSWQTIASKTLSSSSFSFPVKPTTSAVHSYRLQAPGKAGYTADVSSTRQLTVYNARITSILFNPPGADGSNLNGEYIVVKNTGAMSINLLNWRIDAGDGKTKLLPSYALANGATVKLHTGTGTNSAGHIYLRFSTPIWRDTYDTGRLYDANGRLMSSYMY